MYADPDFCYNVGTYVHNQLPSGKEIIFINTEGKYYRQIEFYARKPYILAGSAAEAEQILHKDYPNAPGCYITVVDGNSIECFRIK